MWFVLTGENRSATVPTLHQMKRPICAVTQPRRLTLNLLVKDEDHVSARDCAEKNTSQRCS